MSLRLFFVVLMMLPSMAQAFDTRARAAIVLDYETGAILFEKNAETAFPPASMSKLMTLFMAFEGLQNGRYQLSDRFPVSQRAQDMGGSTMFLNTTDTVTLEDLILGIVVQSGNDACVVIAEAMAGSESAFANQMTKRARDLGLENSTFANSTGWPHPDQKMSAADLATLAVRLIRDFPEYYAYFGVSEFDFDGRAPANRFNRNPLLALNIGADGLKTGHTEESGYGLVGSAVQDDRRVVFVLMGLPSKTARAEESERVTNWAFREFAEGVIFENNAVVASADVWLGNSPNVDLVTGEEIEILYPYADRRDVKANVVFDGPLEAPIAKGDEVATLHIEVPGLSSQAFPLYAASDVGPGSLLEKMRVTAEFFGKKVLDAALSNGE